MEGIKITTINVRGLRDRKKRLILTNWLKRKDFHIVCLQEAYVTQEILRDIERDFHDLGKLYISYSESSHARGVGILISHKLSSWKVITVNKDENGRMILLNIKNINNEVYSIGSFYAPNILQQRIHFITECHKFLLDHAVNRNRMVVAGDFNTCYDKSDRASGKIDKSGQTFSEFLVESNLIDTYRYVNPKLKGYTYIHSYDQMRNSRIDYILTSAALADTALYSSVLPCPAPDHKALTIDLVFNKNKCGEGYWKLNNALLKEQDYVNMINLEIGRIITTYHNCVSKQELLELIKVIVKENSIAYAICRKKKRLCKVSQLEKEIETLDVNISTNNDQELTLKRNLLKTELNELYKEESIAAYIRSRAKWLESGEKSSSYFLNLEKQHQSANRIVKLVNDEGDVALSDTNILDQLKAFYSKLYSSTDPKSLDIENYLEKLNLYHTLSETDSESCEGLITKEECEKALAKMNGNKSPGLDGLSTEFYKTFWNELSDLIVDSFNEAFENGMLSDSRNISVLSLIFKKGDTSKIKNYRPISLTNTDYKLLAHVLANRLHKILHNIISHDQTGYMKKRYIGNNVRKVLDTIEYLNRTNNSGILLMLDFEKAFDTVEWPFLFKVLEKFNFGNQFIKWIKILYKNPYTTIKNNGWLSDKFPLKRGIRQGCPVSALLFILLVEVLAIKLKKNQHKGITVNICNHSKEFKLCQYADDMCIFLKDELQIAPVLGLVQKFADLAGLKLNREKTEGLWLGKDKDRQVDCCIENISWPRDPIRCLGIYIGSCQEKCNYINWWSRLEKIEKLLMSWKMRNLTMLGKVTIINHLIVPNIIFPSQFLEIPKDFVKKFKSSFYSEIPLPFPNSSYLLEPSNPMANAEMRF